jgi:hypothetical protein
LRIALAKEKGLKVFDHLTSDNKFKGKRKVIKRAIILLHRIKDGTFLTECGKLFTVLPDFVLEDRKIDSVTKKVEQLKGSDPNTIRKVILKMR